MKITRQQLKQIIKEEIETVMKESPQILNEIQIGRVLSGITRQGGRRLKAYELTEQYFLELSKLGLAEDSLKLITDFMRGLDNAKKVLNQQQQA